MLIATLRTVGGSTMMTIPKPILEGLGFAANEQVTLRIDGRRLVVEPRSRPKYTLAELVAQCDGNADPDAVAREWEAAEPVGREVIE
jgi:antitoxin ChpS